jgi:hypothetical protein
MKSESRISQEELEIALKGYYTAVDGQADSSSKLDPEELFAARPQRGRALGGFAQGLVAIAAGLAIAAVILVPRLSTVPAAGSPSFSPAPGKLEPDPSVGKAGLARNGSFWVAYRGSLVVSADGGQTWSTQGPAVPPAQANDALTNMFVLDPDHYWSMTDPSAAAGATTPAAVHGTTDGGGTWFTTAAPSECGSRAIALSFVDAEHGFMVCQQGVTVAGSPGKSHIFRTQDGGRSWEPEGACASDGLLSAASDASTVWVAGRQQLEGASPPILVSHDGGLTCGPVDLPGLANLSGATIVSVPVPPSFSDGLNGRLTVAVDVAMKSPALWFYQTTDGGRSWTRTVRDLAFLDPSNAETAQGSRLVTVSVRHMSVSDDAGSTWTDFDPTGLPTDKPFSWLAFSDKAHGLALVFEDGSGFVLHVTADGGRTWGQLDLASATPARLP